MELSIAMEELYASPKGFRVDADVPGIGRVTLYRNARGIKVTPQDAPVRSAIKLSADAPQDEPAIGGG